jgi:hypothetical protein
MKKNNLLKTLPLSVGVFALSLALGYTILAWTEPTFTPPNNNVAAPLNIGSIDQTKAGGLESLLQIKSPKFCIGSQCCDSWLNCLMLGLNGSCKAVGAACAVNADCCSASCVSNVCASTATCKAAGIACTTNSNCCSALCSGGVCVNNASASSCANPATQWVVGIGTDGKVICQSGGGGPICQASGLSCASISCCAGLTCNASKICVTGGGGGGAPGPAPCGNPLPNYNASIKQKRVFVTDSPFNGYAVTSETGADNECQAAAEAAGMASGGSPKFKALVYYGNRDPFNSTNGVLWSSVYYYNGQDTAGTGICTWNLVAMGKGDFMTTGDAGPTPSDPVEAANEYIKSAIKYNENGSLKNVEVLTNFKISGGSYSLLTTGLAWVDGSCGCGGACPGPNGPYWRGNCVTANGSCLCSCCKAISWYGSSTSKQAAYVGQQYLTGSNCEANARNIARSFYCVEQ